MHREAGDVRCPHVIGTADRHLSQPAGIDRTRRTPCADVGLAIQCMNPHRASSARTTWREPTGCHSRWSILPSILLPANGTLRYRSSSRRIRAKWSSDTSPHDSWRFVAKSRSRQARQARGAARRGNTPPGSSEGGVPPSWGFYKGAGPLVRVGEASFWAELTREGGILESVC